jgi:hypothetical protein
VICLFVINSDAIEGSPVAVIEFIKSHAYDHERFESLEAYMDFTKHAIWRFYGVGIAIEGSTIEEKCQSLINQLIENNFLIIN